MTDGIVIAVLAVIVGVAARYVYRAKKSGAKCIGCPAGGSCCTCAKGNCPSTPVTGQKRN